MNIKKKRKKKSTLESMLLSIVQETMKATLDKAFEDLFKGWK